MDAITILIFFGFILAGVIIGVSIGYALGRRDERRLFDPLMQHIAELHRSLNHKSFIVLTPRVGLHKAVKRERQ